MTERPILFSAGGGEASSDPTALVAELLRAVTTGEDGCGTLPAKQAVKVRPADWHRITKLAREAAALIAQQAATIEAGFVQPIETAPETDEFLAPNVSGDWTKVVRFRSRNLPANAVICGRIGRWWESEVWMPLPAARAALSTAKERGE